VGGAHPTLTSLGDFGEMMSEDTPTCQIHQKNSWIKCTHPTVPGDPDGLCILHSHDPAKDPAAFWDALRSIWSKQESKYLDFRGVFFSGSFDPQHFFGSREFSKPVDFSMATFMQEADFSNSIFTKGADFSRTTFNGDVSFFGATFNEMADFHMATFNQRMYFHAVRIGGWVNFSMINLPKPNEPSPPFQGDFRVLAFQDKGVLRFEDLSLAYCRFSYSDLREIEFRHVAWYPYRGRQALYDEFLLRQREKERPWFWEWFTTWLSAQLPLRSFVLELGPALAAKTEEKNSSADPPWGNIYGAVERLYRDLQENYEKGRDYKKMGDFHYGEMEMHRRVSKWRWFPGYWYNIYWGLSGYGERPSRALVWLAAFLIVFTCLLALTGLDPVPPHQPAFGDAFFYLLQKATLQRPEWANPLSFWGKLVAGFSVFLIPGQAALFLLALRNRLGRRR
jgi:hypothetical protein